PNSNYTTADFERDRDTCTDKKTKVLDEGCMKDRGWAALGGDIAPATKPPDPSTAGRSKGKDYEFVYGKHATERAEEGRRFAKGVDSDTRRLAGSRNLGRVRREQRRGQVCPPV